MAADLRAWIKDHLVEVAETYGANLSGVPLEAKGKKAQISEVCATFPFGCAQFDFRRSSLPLELRTTWVYGAFVFGRPS
jgi:hypothetical protein